MLDLAGGTTVYLACGATDLRKSYHGLAAIIKLKFKLDPYSRCMFAFCNRRRTSIKILQWDGSGFWILMKRLDRDSFHWPDTPDELQKVKRLFLCKGRYSRWDVNKVKAEYSYKDKCFLNVQIEKYGSNHLNDVLYTVYLLNISELLPEILTSISSCFTKAIRNSKEQFAKEIIDSQVIVDMIILKSFIFYSDEIKKDEKLINAYEDILLALTEIRNEKAAVLLDEFRIH